jgi:hypothetical protein
MLGLVSTIAACVWLARPRIGIVSRASGRWDATLHGQMYDISHLLSEEPLKRQLLR